MDVCGRLWTFPRLRSFAFWHEERLGEDEYGALVGRYLQGKTDILEENAAPVPLCLPQTSRGQTLDRTLASAVTGRRRTA